MSRLWKRLLLALTVPFMVLMLTACPEDEAGVEPVEPGIEGGGIGEEGLGEEGLGEEELGEEGVLEEEGVGD